MSSILDALNKLERETSPPNFPLTRATAGRKVFSAGRVAVLAGIAGLCLAVIGIAAYDRIQSAKQPEPRIESGLPATTPGAPPDVLASQKSPGSLPPVRSTSPPPPAPADSARPPVESRTASAPPAQAALLEIPPPQNPVAKPPKPPEPETASTLETGTGTAAGTVFPESQEPKAPVSTMETDTEQTEQADPLPDTAVVAKPPTPISKLEGAGLKIQAISWGEAANDRLAVINNQVLREGDHVEGYQISRINPDDIVLSQGGKNWRLDFTLNASP